MEFEEGGGIIKELRLREIEQEVSVKNIELKELFPGGYLRRSPLDDNPSTAMSNLRTKLGNRCVMGGVRLRFTIHITNNPSGCSTPFMLSFFSYIESYLFTYFRGIL